MTVSSTARLERLANDTAVLQRGMIVAPRIGRVVSFTGGGENIHSVRAAAAATTMMTNVYLTHDGR